VKARISRRNQTRPQQLRRYNNGKLTSAAAKEDFSITQRNKFQIFADIDTDSIDSKWERKKDCPTIHLRREAGLQEENIQELAEG